MTGATIKLIVAADEPALFYSSIDVAERALEWIDVENGVYPIAYDPDGNIYRLRHENRRVIIERDGNKSDPRGLNVLLRKAVSALHMPIKSDDNAFLLSLCLKHVHS
jgi:hypothetical protein